MDYDVTTHHGFQLISSISLVITCKLPILFVDQFKLCQAFMNMSLEGLQIQPITFTKKPNLYDVILRMFSVLFALEHTWRQLFLNVLKWPHSVWANQRTKRSRREISSTTASCLRSYQQHTWKVSISLYPTLLTWTVAPSREHICFSTSHPNSCSPPQSTSSRPDQRTHLDPGARTHTNAEQKRLHCCGVQYLSAAPV